MKNPLFLLVFLFTVSLMAASIDSDGYILDWLVSGPYPSYEISNGEHKGVDDNFLEGGEENERPYPGKEATAEFFADTAKLIAKIGATNEWGFTETKCFSVDWTEHHFDDPIISLDNLTGPIEDYFVMYMAVWLEISRDCTAKIRLGSDDDHKVWLNGKLIGKSATSQGVQKDNFIYDAQLGQGLNYLLLKVVDRTQGCGFCLAVTDADDTPLKGLQAYTDNPARQYGADYYCQGYASKIAFDEQPVYDGWRTGKITVFSPDGGSVSVLLKDQQLNLESGVEQEFSLNLQAGEQLIRAEVLGSEFEDGGNAVFNVPVMVYSKEALQAENQRLKEHLTELKKKLPEAEAACQKAESDYEAARQFWYDAFDECEARYAEQRAEAVADAPVSIDEPLPDTSGIPRSLLCINGEWKLSADRQNWNVATLPQIFREAYFRNTLYPIVFENPHEPYGPVRILKGWEDFHMNPDYTNPRQWWRKKLELKAGIYTEYVCKNITGEIEVFMNGESCGSYKGFMGEVRVPLKNIRDGENTLEIFLSSLGHGTFDLFSDWGFGGSSYIETSDAMHVADAWVKTSWRNGTVKVITELKNDGDTTRQIEMRQYVAEGNRMRLVLPSKIISVEAGALETVENSSAWANPKCWGIGGEYGNPDLYQMVTDLYDGEQLIDHHVQSFGFREFWIHVTDFYLNGKRIVLQGDIGPGGELGDAIKNPEIVWQLLRADGINIKRTHSHDGVDDSVASLADRMGMLLIVQNYPMLREGAHDPNNLEKCYPAYEEWFDTDLHQFNVKQYTNWHRLFRNHPSVVIWSTDNEVCTQCNDLNDPCTLRTERLAAWYEKFTKSLDPDIIMTRDGDRGTWNSKEIWSETPPCDTANYHYPDFDVNRWVKNWQKVYEWRPPLFGETLYYAFGAWNNWAPPSQENVAKEAAKISRIASIYRDLEIPGAIYMGLSSDGFVVYDESGAGNPWGYPVSIELEYFKAFELPDGISGDEYPYRRINWPAQSGEGIKPICSRVMLAGHGWQINWYDPSRPTHVRSAINDAYRDSLKPQPQLRVGSDAECIICTGIPFAAVWCTTQCGARIGVMADQAGRAWFNALEPGDYTFECNGKSRELHLNDRSAYAAIPGFDQVPIIDWNEK